MTVQDIKLITESENGTLLKVPATIQYVDGRIEFLKSPFALKDEIKAMKGSKWHGFEDKNPRKIWSIEDCPRNRFQLAYLMGENSYEWFDQEILERSFERPLMLHQRDLVNQGLTYHFGIWGAEMGVGKTLGAIEVIEQSGVDEWFWVGPKASLEAIKREFKKWGLAPHIKVETYTYEALVRIMDEWPRDKKPPKGVIFDESSKLKTATSQRTKAAQKLGDLIRYHYGYDGYVILMSGTPSPKSPVDWWAQAEVAWPGFLREGSPKALEQRLGLFELEEIAGVKVTKRLAWRDSTTRCEKCGKDELEHDFALMVENDNVHDFVACKNEVSLMYERLKGLVVIKHKKDCLDLPDKQYRKIYCKPNKSTLRVARALVDTAETTSKGAALLRELSDGFQYRMEHDGTMVPCSHCEGSGEIDEWFDDTDRSYKAIDMLDPKLVEKLEKRRTKCPDCKGKKELKHMVRITKEVPSPKETALRELLEENEEQGRIVIFAGFTGSVDRCVRLCLKNQWDVFRCDGRGMVILRQESDGEVTQLPDEDCLEYWANRDNTRVAFVAHPESGGMGLTLTEASMAVFYSNSYKPEYRVQAEDRIHRPGMDHNRGATIVDLLHLPTDERALQIIRENRRIELMTMGEIADCLSDDAAGEGFEVAA